MPSSSSRAKSHFTLAGGFQRGKEFKVRDSATYVSKATGRGGSFIRIEDPGPKGNQLTVIDGFDISGYSQAIFRDYYESQRFDITNNHIHDNRCANDELVGAGFALEQRLRPDRRQRVQEQFLRPRRRGLPERHHAKPTRSRSSAT